MANKGHTFLRRMQKMRIFAAMQRKGRRMRRVYYPVFALWWLLSLLPLRLLYALADGLLFPLVYGVMRYRRRLVAQQLADSLPECSAQDRKRIGRDFYRFFCDYLVETLKMMSMSEAEVRRRVEWVGLEELKRTARTEGKPVNLAYLGHLGNWEWMSSAGLHLMPDFGFAQIYHPLRNASIDALFLHVRGRFGGRCVAMRETLRHIVETARAGRNEVVGFIADQSPKWEAMHQWCRFLHHDTSFFIGVESIAKRVDGAVYYVDVTRPRRGYYRAEVKLVTLRPKEFKDFELTDRYAQLLEESIRRNPHLWLWTHKRWKRSRAEWEERQRRVPSKS